jgi:hypothetical protein
MTTKFSKFSTSTGLAATVLAMGAAGLGLGSGIAQADPMTPMFPDPHHQLTVIHDRIVDRINRDLMFVNGQFQRHCERFDARLDRHFEGTLTDRITDVVCGTM